MKADDIQRLFLAPPQLSHLDPHHNLRPRFRAACQPLASRQAANLPLLRCLTLISFMAWILERLASWKPPRSEPRRSTWW